VERLAARRSQPLDGGATALSNRYMKHVSSSDVVPLRGDPERAIPLVVASSLAASAGVVWFRYKFDSPLDGLPGTMTVGSNVTDRDGRTAIVFRTSFQHGELIEHYVQASPGDRTDVDTSGVSQLDGFVIAPFPADSLAAVPMPVTVVPFATYDGQNRMISAPSVTITSLHDSAL
jgi:hypothetical protein